jgi:cob(I)alamin adenosyltransferase
LFGGRVSKANPVVEVCGAVDEAVAALGMARASLEDQGLQAIVLDLQRGLFVAAAEGAANPRARDRLVPGTSTVSAGMTAALEQTIDRPLAEHPSSMETLSTGVKVVRRSSAGRRTHV